MTPFAALEFTVAFDNAVVIPHGLSSGGSKKIAVVFFFICYLAAPGSALGHYRGANLIQPRCQKLRFVIFDPKVTRCLEKRLGPYAWPSA